jgi:SAM-dependent methyltransferase
MEWRQEQTVGHVSSTSEIGPPAPFSLEAATVESDQARRRLSWSPAGLRRHHEIISGISDIFRRNRTGDFLRLFRPSRHTRILDVGGLPRFWKGVPMEAQVTIVNLQPLPSHEAAFLTPNQTFKLADGTRLPWEDQSFDVVFSNSVIEHLGSWENQIAFARECQRVGKAWWIQTPAREFPVEPHYITPFLHWFPKSVQKRCLRRCSLWGWLARPRAEAIDASLAELRLLKSKEFKSLFPGSRIKTERLFGLPKSYVAFKPPAV